MLVTAYIQDIYQHAQAARGDGFLDASLMRKTFRGITLTVENAPGQRLRYSHVIYAMPALAEDWLPDQRTWTINWQALGRVIGMFTFRRAGAPSHSAYISRESAARCRALRS